MDLEIGQGFIDSRLYGHVMVQPQAQQFLSLAARKYAGPGGRSALEGLSGLFINRSSPFPSLAAFQRGVYRAFHTFLATGKICIHN
jgi:hypothetical protein